jgi:hypothetical protein
MEELLSEVEKRVESIDPKLDLFAWNELYGATISNGIIALHRSEDELKAHEMKLLLGVMETNFETILFKSNDQT